MIDFLNRNIFTPHPELLVFLVVALGFLIGRIRYRAIALGAVTGCLVATAPTLGYTIPYAVGHVLLTVWGAVIVILNH
ncbi:hypothetical protein [Streptomyces laculatispora]|uniref:hypothetical protein n=1 Tax=Streptomyces laculatispora TaxID=887464 RepID=UPI001A93B45C|nr:hypothetical protein [Streptomyces laculatispora]MBO0916981.1 hypothetical protein [Streptomyces laculatispora]